MTHSSSSYTTVLFSLAVQSILDAIALPYRSSLSCPYITGFFSSRRVLHWSSSFMAVLVDIPSFSIAVHSPGAFSWEWWSSPSITKPHFNLQLISKTARICAWSENESHFWDAKTSFQTSYSHNNEYLYNYTKCNQQYKSVGQPYSFPGTTGGGGSFHGFSDFGTLPPPALHPGFTPRSPF